jgi:glutathionylspermidine amidase/synthetase
VFGDVDVAADMWSGIDQLRRVADNAPLPLDNHLNGGGQPPAPGDLLIYGREFLGTGHVAVVLQTDAAGGVVRVGEQNYRNAAWSGSYARAIPLVRHAEKYWLLDPHLIGWKRLRDR